MYFDKDNKLPDYSFLDSFLGGVVETDESSAL